MDYGRYAVESVHCIGQEPRAACGQLAGEAVLRLPMASRRNSASVSLPPIRGPLVARRCCTAPATANCVGVGGLLRPPPAARVYQQSPTGGHLKHTRPAF